MVASYFTTGIRSILRNKVFALLNILGLTLGLSVFILIMVYITFELSYDRFHENAPHIYQVRLVSGTGSQANQDQPTTYHPTGPAMREDFAEVTASARLHRGLGIMSYKDVKFYEESIYYADQSFLSIFTFPLVEGTAKLSEPNTCLITESAARKYFGTENPIGKTLTNDNQYWGRGSFVVTGILKDIPANSHLQFSFLFSIDNILKWDLYKNSWQWSNFNTYVLLSPEADPEKLAAKLPAFSRKYLSETMKNNKTKESFALLPFRDIYLHASDGKDAGTISKAEMASLFSVIAAFILIIAWANYINLSTARAMERAKEVGIRKVAGAERSQLIVQFLMESVLLNLAAAVLAIIVSLCALPLLQKITDQELNVALRHADFWLLFAGAILAGSFFSGLYPAFVLSSFKPISVLKGKIRHIGSGLVLRKSLVIFQFTASIVLIAGALTVYKQMKYMRSQDLGVDITHTLILDGPSLADQLSNETILSFKKELLRQSSIRSVSTSTDIPGKNYNWSESGISSQEDNLRAINDCKLIYVDYDFFNLYQLNLVAGRSFSEKFSTDGSTIILNEKSASLLGYRDPRRAITKVVSMPMVFPQTRTASVIGVVKNYHHLSLKNTYDPIIFVLRPASKKYFSLKLSTATLEQVIPHVENTWNKFFQGNPIKYYFLHDAFNEQYKAEQRFEKLFNFFTVIAIVIACLGLIGLASYTIVQKSKEISIRKLFGASNYSLVYLLTIDFVRMVGMATLLASPLVYLLASNWLDDFAFAIKLDVWIFVIPALTVLVIVLALVALQTVKATKADPIQALKND